MKTMGQCQLEARFNISRDVSAKRSERSRPPRRARIRPPYGRRETSLVCRQTRSHCELQMFGSASGFGNEAPLLVRISLSRSLNFTEMRLVCFFLWSHSLRLATFDYEALQRHSDDLTLMNA